MANTRPNNRSTLTQLTAENKQLKAENKKLRTQLAEGQPVAQPRQSRGTFWRKLGVVFAAACAVALLIAGNLLFWAGNTIVKNDRFTQTVAPIIQSTEVQHAIADYTTARLYENVDVTQVVQDALPPRADFLAPTISTSLEGYTTKALQKTLANPKFQTTWNSAISGAHARLIHTVEQHGQDGVIDLNEVYQQLSSSLKDTKLSFLANRKLPTNVGTIEVASGTNIEVLNRIITHIDAWRVLAITLFVLFSALAIYLSRRKRRAVLGIALYGSIGLFITLVAIRVIREAAANSVDPSYAQAVREAVQITLHPLALQTATIMVALLLVVLVTWLSGPYRSATFIRTRIQLLFSGKLHQALFGERENTVTRWIGRNKRYLEWMVIGLVAILLLIVHLTPRNLLVYGIITILLLLLIELLGAPEGRPSNRKAH